MKLPTIPTDFVKRFLWHPNCPTIPVTESESSPSDQFTPTFPAALSQELQSVISFAFSEASGTQEAPDQPYAVPQTVTLYSSPQTGGNLLIDSAVKMIAVEHHADVLVLDSLEFAAGGLGAMGKAADVIDLMYKVKGEESSSSGGCNTSLYKGDEDAQPFFDALVTLDGKRTSCHGNCTLESADQPKRRIIYLRDFSVISKASMPLMINLLRALGNAQTWAGIHGCTPLTIIVFGMVKFDHQAESLSLGNARPIILKSKVSQRGFSSLLSHLLLPYSNNSSPQLHIPPQLHMPPHCYSCYSNNPPPQVPVDTIWRRRVEELASRTVAVSIFANNRDAKGCAEWEQSEKVARNRDINNLLLRSCLEGKCSDLVGDLSKDISRGDSAKTDTKADTDMATKRMTTEASPILTVSEADSMAGIAAGLASLRSMLVDSSHIAEAYTILKDRKQERATWESARRAPKTAETQEANASDEDPIIKQVREDDLSSEEEELLGCIVNARELSTAFTDICIDYSVIESLQKVVSLPLLYPSYFKSGVLAKEAMGGALLYGPPGTGKTMICRYLAHTCKARMIAIKASDVTCKWAGESERRIAAVFSLATRLAPCVVFIDEADALFSSRKDRIMNWERSMLTEFLQAMDGLTSAAKNKDKGVLVVGATNRPYDLDEAILRRLPCKILVDVPDTAARAKLLERYLRDNKLDADVDLEEIAKQTDNYSGSDIKNLCVAAALASVKDKVGDKWDIPAGSPTAEEELPAPIITLENVRRALNEVFPSLSVDNCEQLRSWGTQYEGPIVTPRWPITQRRPRPVFQDTPEALRQHKRARKQSPNGHESSYIG